MNREMKCWECGADVFEAVINEWECPICGADGGHDHEEE